MENYIVINGKRIDLGEEQIEKLGLINEDKNPFDRVEHDSYYFIDSTGKIINYPDTLDSIDEDLFQAGNYCTDKKLITERAKEEVLNRLLWRFSMENGGDEIDWQDENQRKWYIIHNEHDGEWFTGYHAVCAVRGSVCFIDVEVAKRAINEIIKPFYAGELEVCKIWDKT